MNICQIEINNMNKRIKKIRLTLNLCQKDFAQLLETSQSNISKYERGEMKPALDFLINLNEKLNVNLNWVLIGKGHIFIQNEETGIDIDKIKQALELLNKAVNRT